MVFCFAMLSERLTSVLRSSSFFVWLSQSAQSCTMLAFSSDALPGRFFSLNLWIEWECAVLYLIFGSCCRTFFSFFLFPLMNQWSHWANYFGVDLFCLFVLQINVEHPHLATYRKRLGMAHLQFCAWGYFSSSEKLQDNVIFFENGSVPNGWYSFLCLDRVCFERTC